MFDIGWSEFVVIGVVALIVIGPKELPAVLRAIGQWTTKIRRMAGEFQSQFQEAMREAEMADLKKQVDELSDAAKGITTDPFDFSEATKWEPKSDTASTSATASETTTSDTATSETASATSEPAGAAQSAAEVAGEPAAAIEPAPASDGAAAASVPDKPDSAPHSAEPVAEGSGRA
jgi:sec-independent protein translocase protein TatB